MRRVSRTPISFAGRQYVGRTKIRNVAAKDFQNGDHVFAALHFSPREIFGFCAIAVKTGAVGCDLTGTNPDEPRTAVFRRAAFAVGAIHGAPAIVLESLPIAIAGEATDAEMLRHGLQHGVFFVGGSGEITDVAIAGGVDDGSCADLPEAFLAGCDDGCNAIGFPYGFRGEQVEIDGDAGLAQELIGDALHGFGIEVERLGGIVVKGEAAKTVEIGDDFARNSTDDELIVIAAIARAIEGVDQRADADASAVTVAFEENGARAVTSGGEGCAESGRAATADKDVAFAAFGDSHWVTAW